MVSSAASASRRHPSGSVARAVTLVHVRPFRGPHSGRVKVLFIHATRLSLSHEVDDKINVDSYRRAVRHLPAGAGGVV